MPPHLIRAQRKLERKKKVVEFFTSKKPIYENGKMFAPDGELLSYIDNRKAMWYVKRGLATLESKEPLVVKLLFEPNGRDAK